MDTQTAVWRGRDGEITATPRDHFAPAASQVGWAWPTVLRGNTSKVGRAHPTWLATEVERRAEVIIKAYARRWPIEPLFNQLRHSWGWLDAWQQSRQVLARWVQILFVAYALPQLLVLKGGDRLAALTPLTPWCQDRPVTAGLVRLALQRILGHLNLRAWWDPKSRKFQPPAAADETASEPPLAQVA